MLHAMGITLNYFMTFTSFIGHLIETGQILEILKNI